MKYKCCICGKECTGFGNNPRGSLDQNAQLIDWSASDKCCEECNSDYVITGRILKGTFSNLSDETIIKEFSTCLIKRD